jgi:hypothetical protein
MIYMLMMTNPSSTMQFNRVFHYGGLADRVRNSDFIVSEGSILAILGKGISQQISPIPEDVLKASCLQKVEGSEHTLHFFHTLTGLMFVLIAKADYNLRRSVFDELYQAYVERMLRHPTYQLDHTGAGQPINANQYREFTDEVDRIIGNYQPQRTA